MNKKIIIIQMKAGLCNRLRYMIPYINLFNENNNIKNKIIIIWSKDTPCNGFYLDYFKPIENVTFVTNQKQIQEFNNKNNNIKIITNTMNKNLKNRNEILNIFDKQFFKLNDNIYKKIKNIIINKLSNKYISVHIRRTDLDKHLKKKKIYDKRTCNDDFIKFIDNNKKYNLFIATDNMETQKLLINKYKDRIKYIKIMNHNKNIRRQTELEDAIIDLFLCICSDKFKGTFYSSFSDFIKRVRNNIVKHKNLKNTPFKRLKLFL
jgi:hypothetical protein